MGSTEQVPAPITSSGVLNKSENIIGDGERSPLVIECIRAELDLLSLRQAQVRQRIHHLRHALRELVHVFGPGILVTVGSRSKIGSGTLSRDAAKVIDLSRKALNQSAQWVTLYELLALIGEESPLALARFINPGVAVSNALRVLHRRGEVEAAVDEQPAKWRWIGKPKTLPGN